MSRRSTAALIGDQDTIGHILAGLLDLNVPVFSKPFANGVADVPRDKTPALGR